MKKLTALLTFLVIITAFNCDDEPLDPDFDISSGNTNNSNSLIGEWALVSLNVEGTTTTEVQGISLSADFIGESANPDYYLTFTETDFTSYGTYDYVLQTTVLGQTTTETYAIEDVSGSGTYTTTGNEIVFDGQFMDVSIDGVDQTALSGDDQVSTYSITNNGNTLTINQVVNTVQTQQGAIITIDVNSSSVWQRIGNTQPNDCDAATTAANEAEAAYNADTTNTDLCNAYVTALQNQITACGDANGSIQAIIDGLDCSSPEPMFLHQRITTYTDGSSYTETYTYDGNNLTSILDSDGYEYTYEYENDLLTRINSYDDSGSLMDYALTEYDSQNRLSSYTVYITLDNEGLRFDLTYNADGTITEMEYLGDHNSQTSLISEKIIAMDEDQIFDIALTDGSIETSYSYDNKNGIYKNISNLKTLNLLHIDFSGYIEGGMNNVLTVSDDQSVFEEYEYTYNANNYPETSTDYWEGQLESTTQYTYY